MRHAPRTPAHCSTQLTSNIVCCLAKLCRSSELCITRQFATYACDRSPQSVLQTFAHRLPGCQLTLCHYGHLYSSVARYTTKRSSAIVRSMAQHATGTHKHVAVLGAGVIGLTSALRILQEFPDCQVTIVAHHLGWETTSAGAAGLWGPFKLWDTPEDLVKRWAGTTLDHLYEVLHSDQAATAGLSLRGVHTLQELPVPPPDWSDLTDTWTPLSPRKLANINRNRKSGPPFAQGWFYHAIACEGGYYLRWLHRQILELGGIVLQTPQPLSQLSQLYDLEMQATWKPAPMPPVSSDSPKSAVRAAPQMLSTDLQQDQYGITGMTLTAYVAQQASTKSSLTAGTIKSHTHGSQPTLPEAQSEGDTAGGVQAPMQFDAVVNCCGIGARKLLADDKMAPIRGQVLRVAAPWVTAAYFSDMVYIIPNNYSVVLGGTAQIGDWNEEPSEADRKKIIETCLELLPSLADARILHDWVGLRPGRTCVRLELDTLTVQGVGSSSHNGTSISKQESMQVPVVHNYGHGGSGLTLAWGCAGDVVELLKTSL